MAPNPNTKQRKSDAVNARRARVSALILAGMTEREIAGALNVSLGTVNGDAQELRVQWRKQQLDNIDDALALDLTRIESLIKSVWAKAKQGNLGAMDRVIRMIELRKEIYDYQAPKDTGDKIYNPITIIEVHRPDPVVTEDDG